MFINALLDYIFGFFKCIILHVYLPNEQSITITITITVTITNVVENSADVFTSASDSVSDDHFIVETTDDDESNEVVIFLSSDRTDFVFSVTSCAEAYVTLKPGQGSTVSYRLYIGADFSQRTRLYRGEEAAEKRL